MKWKFRGALSEQSKKAVLNFQAQYYLKIGKKITQPEAIDILISKHKSK